jgi:predicted amidohydrolase YtcJ
MLGTCDGPQPPAKQPADLVLRNGNVVTVDQRNPAAEALVVAGDRIVAVGSNAGIDEWVGDSTEVIDIAGQTALSQGLLTVPDDLIINTGIVMTIVGGRIRFRNGLIIDR